MDYISACLHSHLIPKKESSDRESKYLIQRKIVHAAVTEKNTLFRPLPWLWALAMHQNNDNPRGDITMPIDVVATWHRESPVSSERASSVAAGIVGSSYKLLQSIVAGSFPHDPENYRHNPGIVECLDPVSRILNLVDTSSLANPNLQEIHSTTLSQVKAACNTAKTIRGAIRMQAKRDQPVPIKTFEPEIDENFAPGKLPPSATNSQHRKAEVRALQRAVKREQRGAARELRLDAQYLTRVRDQERAEREAEREEKAKEMQQLLESQQASVNQMARQGVTRGGGTKK
eukprot:gb/GECG01006946.1/.p1 GENE.gb/GECG01006946.1/~~gb/GECG01006946.1/.p1  ORF type:complete len:288 (+),score=36.39 gb/GECG01006946.1/:1-864(+)